MNDINIFIQKDFQKSSSDHLLQAQINQDLDYDAYIDQFLYHQYQNKQLSSSNHHQTNTQNTEIRTQEESEQQNDIENLKNSKKEKQYKKRKQKSQDFSEKKRRQRPSDHNLCKKFHTYANRCLRKIKVYKYIKPFLKKIHKRNYFLFVLVIAEKTKKFQEFKQAYQEKADQIYKQYKQYMSKDNSLIQFRSIQQEFLAMQSSMKALNLFEKGELKQALEQMFNIQKLKRLNWVQQAFNQVLSFGEIIQQVIERVPTRF